MALMQCPECRSEVSSTALKCARCNLVLRKPRRGPIGAILKWLFILWNVLMIVWIVAGVVDASNTTVHNRAEEAGRAIGTSIGVGLLLFLWMIGSIILGLLVYFTRPTEANASSSQAVRLTPTGGDPDRSVAVRLREQPAAYRFSDAQLVLYGMQQVSVLEKILAQDPNDPISSHTMRSVSEKIRAKIAYTDTVVDAPRFLHDFFVALRDAQHPAAEATRVKRCPFCAEDIRAEAIKCKHCGSSLESALR